MHTSAEDIYYLPGSKVRHNFFGMLNYGDANVQSALPSLLTLEGYHFREDYQKTQLDSKQSLELFKSYFPRRELHPIVLPFRLVSANRVLAEKVGKKIEEYNTGVITLDGPAPMYFATKHMRIVLAGLGAEPALCGDYNVHVRFSLLKFPSSWEFTENVLERLNWRSEWLILKVIGQVYHTLIAEGLLRVEEPLVGTPKVLPIYQEMKDLVGGMDWQNKYLRILVLINEAMGDFSPARKALWHGKLLYVTIACVRNYGPVLHHDEFDADFISKMVKEFIFAHEPDEVPPFIMRSILNFMRFCSKTYHFRDDQSFNTKVMRLYELYPGLKGLESSDLKDSISNWKYYLRDRHPVCKLSIPDDLHESDDFIKWWGDYKNIEEVVLVSPKLAVPVMMSFRERNVRCTTTGCFLLILTDMFNDIADHFWDEGIPKLASYPTNDGLWYAWVRTILTNLLNMGDPGMGVSVVHLGKVCTAGNFHIKNTQELTRLRFLQALFWRTSVCELVLGPMMWTGARTLLPGSRAQTSISSMKGQLRCSVSHPTIICLAFIFWAILAFGRFF
jgi:hypothetical protein